MPMCHTQIFKQTFRSPGRKSRHLASLKPGSIEPAGADFLHNDNELFKLLWLHAVIVGTQLPGLGNILFLVRGSQNDDRHYFRARAVVQPIQHVIISAEVGWRKPAAEFFAAVCRNLGLPGDQILVVGDDLVNDVQGAQTAGLRAIWFNRAGSNASTSPISITQLADLVK